MEVSVTKNFFAIDNAFNAGKKGIVLRGSAGSSKTFSAIQWLSYHGMKNKARMGVYRQFRSSAKESVAEDFKKILSDEDGMLDKWNPDGWNQSDLRYTFDTGSTLSFIGCDKASKRKGKREDISYFNEVTECNRESYDQVAMRSSFMILDFNPSHAHWVDKFKANDDFVWVDSTFRDNPMLPEGQRATILGYEPTKDNIARLTADDAMWQIYGLGMPAILKGRIFNNWEETTEWPDVNACERRGYGCDIGFVDPTTVIECRLAHNTLYLRQKVWAWGITDLPNPERFETSLVEACQDNGVTTDQPIYVDNAYPQTIKALRSYKFNAIPCEKGRGSILEGIMMLRRFRIKIHVDSPQLIKEFASYCWKMDLGGIPMDKPLENGFDHGIDSVRYWAKAQLSNTMMGNPRGKRTTRARGAVKHY